MIYTSCVTFYDRFAMRSQACFIAFICLIVCLVTAGSIRAQSEGVLDTSFDLLAFSYENGVHGFDEDFVEHGPTKSGLGFEGSWSLQVYGSASLGNSEGEIYASHLGGGYYFVDNLSMNLEVVIGEVDIGEGDRGSASVYGLDLLFRWLFYRHDRWTIYLDGGAGIQQSSSPFPAAGTHFNFRPQFGIGFLYRLREEIHFLAGLRWLHISNADKDGQRHNPGYDAGMFYSGIVVSF